MFMGALEFDLAGEAPGYVQVLNEIVETGYIGTELGDWVHAHRSGQVVKRDSLTRLKLLARSCRCCLKTEAHAAGVEVAVRTAKLMAAVEGDLPSSCWPTTTAKTRSHEERGRVTPRWPERSRVADRWERDEGGRGREEEAGLRTAFHHHCAGFVETPAEIEKLLSLTDPKLLALCLTAVTMPRRRHPVEGLRKLGSRVWHFHSKITNPTSTRRLRQVAGTISSREHGVFCELGKGNVNFPALIAELKRSVTSWVWWSRSAAGMGQPKESRA